jgi:uncharacterized protein YceK
MGFWSVAVAVMLAAAVAGCATVNSDVQAAEKAYRQQLGKGVSVGQNKTAGEEPLPLASGGDLV